MTNIRTRIAALEQRRPKFDLAAAIVAARKDRPPPRYSRAELEAIATDGRRPALVRQIAAARLRVGHYC